MPTATPDSFDGPLLAQVALGRESALEALQERYGPLVASYVRRWIDDPTAVDEVVQDIWLSVWRTARNFRGECRVRTWILAIGHHVVASRLRRRGPVSVSLDYLVHFSDPTGQTPEEEASRTEWREAVRRAISRLPPVHRATLDLVFVQELSLREVAEVMGCPVGTVKSRLSYAKRSLRKMLEDLKDDRDG